MGEVRREQLERLIPVLAARIEVVGKRALTV
jgi:hypothetical protein